jgi:hypothetical protein
MLTTTGGREHRGGFRSHRVGKEVVPAHDVGMAGLDILAGNWLVVCGIGRLVIAVC